MKEDLIDFVWNPGLETSNYFAFCLNNGHCKIMEVTKKDDICIIGVLDKEQSCSCCKIGNMLIQKLMFLILVCWSPKGKQLVVGRTDGSLTQYDCHFSIKKQINKPQYLASVKGIHVVTK